MPESRSDAVARKAIGKITNSRSAEADKQAAELTSTRQELETVKQKHDAAVSRRKVGWSRRVVYMCLPRLCVRGRSWWPLLPVH